MALLDSTLTLYGRKVHHISKGWKNKKRNVPLKFNLLEHQGRTVGQWWYCLQERSHRNSGGSQEETHC